MSSKLTRKRESFRKVRSCAYQTKGFVRNFQRKDDLYMAFMDLEKVYED